MSSKSVESSNVVVDSNCSQYGPGGEMFGQSVPSPVILTPGPASQFPAGTHVLISGTCEANAKVEVYLSDGGKVGDAVVVGTRWFIYRVWGTTFLGSEWWCGWLGHPASAWLFYAVQTVDGRVSLPTVGRLLAVGKMEKSPVPVVTLPLDGSEYPLGWDNGFITLGTCVPGALLNWTTNFYPGLGSYAEHEGVWAGTNWWSSTVTETYQFRQTVPGFLPSDPTDPITVRFVDRTSDGQKNIDSEATARASSVNALKPPVPTIETPLDGSSSFLFKREMIKGACVEGASVELQFETFIQVVRVVGKSWYFWFNGDNKPTTRSFRVRQIVGGQFSEWSDTVTVSFFMSAPLIVFPVHGSNHPVGSLYMSGICDGDAIVEVLNEDGDVLDDAVVKGTTWVYDREWAKGVHHVRVKQTLRGRTSPLSELHEIIIR